MWAVPTLGGLQTLPGGEVLDPEGAAIPELYVGGRTTSGIVAYGFGVGISLGGGTLFGRRAGRSAARTTR